MQTICLACHMVGGAGGVVGPALDEVYLRKSRPELLAWVADPQGLKPGTPMPQIDMTEEQREEIVDWLLSLASVPQSARPAPTAPVKQEIYE